MPLYIPGTIKVQAVDELLQDRDKVLKMLHHHLVMAQSHMKVQADRHRCEVIFEMGDYVYFWF